MHNKSVKNLSDQLFQSHSNECPCCLQKIGNSAPYCKVISVQVKENPEEVISPSFVEKTLSGQGRDIIIRYRYPEQQTVRDETAPKSIFYSLRNEIAPQSVVNQYLEFEASATFPGFFPGFKQDITTKEFYDPVSRYIYTWDNSFYDSNCTKTIDFRKHLPIDIIRNQYIIEANEIITTYQALVGQIVKMSDLPAIRNKWDALFTVRTIHCYGDYDKVSDIKHTDTSLSLDINEDGPNLGVGPTRKHVASLLNIVVVPYLFKL